MAVGVGLACCQAAPDASLSCAELAEARAAEQLDGDIARLDQEEAGTPHQSDLRRRFIRMDAEAYRTKVYEECLRRRGLTAEEH